MLLAWNNNLSNFITFFKSTQYTLLSFNYKQQIQITTPPPLPWALFVIITYLNKIMHQYHHLDDKWIKALLSTIRVISSLIWIFCTFNGWSHINQERWFKCFPQWSNKNWKRQCVRERRCVGETIRTCLSMKYQKQKYQWKELENK